MDSFDAFVRGFSYREVKKMDSFDAFVRGFSYREVKKMDSFDAFVRGYASRHEEKKVFDWAKAAEIIKERNVEHAWAGLLEDWEDTGALIFENRKPVVKELEYIYLLSSWATPVLILTDCEVIDCYKMESETPDWDGDTIWPQEALDIIGLDVTYIK